MVAINSRAARNGIGDAFRRTVARCGTKEAVIWRDRTWTFEALETAAYRVATALARLGLRKGDRVAALARNSDGYLILWLACAQSGLIHVPVNYGLTPPELRYILEQSGARLLVVDGALAAQVELIRDVSSLDFVARFEDAAGIESGQCDDLNVIAAASDEDGECVREWDVTGEDPAQIIYTSGTTGAPKGGLMSHAALVAEYVSCIQACDFVAQDQALSALPLYHAGQLHTFTMPQLLVGSTEVLLEQPKPVDVFQAIATYGISSFFAPPTVWISLLRHEGFDTHDLSTINKLYYGASIMPATILAELRDRFPGVLTYNCYGQSEVGPLATVLRPEDHDGRLTSAGKPVFNVETRVVDDDMNDAPVGEVGEIVHRSPQLISSYWDKPAETADAFFGDWFHSGDVGYFDAQGFLYIVDRIKDVINTGGVLVASREVEDALFKHASVYEVAVIGLPDPKWVEAITAVVVCREGEQGDEAMLMQHARERLAPFKLPKKFIFVQELPRNASGKILKRELRGVYGSTSAAFES